MKLKPKEINFTTCQDLEGVSLRGMLEAPDGSIYIATYNGLFRYYPKENRAYLQRRTWHDIFFHLAQIRGDTITALSESNRIGNYNLSTPWKFNEAPIGKLTKDFSFYSSYPLEDGWILAGNQQLFRLRPKDLRVEPFCMLPTSASVRCICFKPARDGRIWLGTSEGVFILSKDGKYEVPAIRNDVRLGPESRINDIFEAENGMIWFATHNYGLVCYDPVTAQIHSYDQSTGFSTRETYKMASGQDGKVLWVSTFTGLYCIELRSNKIHYFNASDGTSGNEFNTGSFLKSGMGEFYFGGVRGLTRFDPEQFKPNSAPLPKPYITELLIEDVYSNVIHTLYHPKQDTLLQFSNSQNTLEFHFGSNDYFRPKTNTYYVKLLNIDSDWVPLGAVNQLKYYRLAAGHYTLSVKFNINGDKENSQIYAINFIIDEVYYKKWWFIAIVGIALLGMVWGVWALKRRRYQREENMRRTIAHDLHNALGGRISSISNMLYVIDGLNKSGQPFQKELGQMLELTRNAHSAMSDVIWILSRKNNAQAGLVNRMEDYADRWLKIARIKVVFEHNIADQGKTLPFAIQHELLLVYKEMLGNILKHTFTESVHIRFASNPDQSLDLMVSNHFSKRKEDVPSGGQGLLIIKEHVEKNEGTLTVTSMEQDFVVHIHFDNPYKKHKKHFFTLFFC